MLHNTALEFQLDVEIAKAKTIAHNNGHTDTKGYENDKEHVFNQNILQLVKSDFTAIGLQIDAEIESMIVHEIMDYHVKSSFPVRYEHVKVRK